MSITKILITNPHKKRKPNKDPFILPTLSPISHDPSPKDLRPKKLYKEASGEYAPRTILNNEKMGAEGIMLSVHQACSPDGKISC